MSYFQEIDAWIGAVIFAGPNEGESDEDWLARLRAEIKAKILESYRNGQNAAEQPAQRPPKVKAEEDGRSSDGRRYRGFKRSGFSRKRS